MQMRHCHFAINSICLINFWVPKRISYWNTTKFHVDVTTCIIKEENYTMFMTWQSVVSCSNVYKRNFRLDTIMIIVYFDMLKSLNLMHIKVLYITLLLLDSVCHSHGLSVPDFRDKNTTDLISNSSWLVSIITLPFQLSNREKIIQKHWA